MLINKKVTDTNVVTVAYHGAFTSSSSSSSCSMYEITTHWYRAYHTHRSNGHSISR